MVKIRLTRLGKKHRPFYRIVACDSHTKRDGRFLEILGTYDPGFSPSKVKLEKEKYLSWIQKGAQPTKTVRDIAKRLKIN